MPTAQMTKIIARIKRHRSIMDLDKRGLGTKLLDISMEVMIRDFNRRVSPDGSGWAGLSPEYEKWKMSTHPGQPQGYLDELMATYENFHGERIITATEAQSIFGVTEQAKEECHANSEGDPPDRPARPFIGISAECHDLSDKFLAQHLKKHV